jgi:hypothetical protein
MNLLLAIDPGPVDSAFVVWDGAIVMVKDKINNEAMAQMANRLTAHKDVYCAIEMIASYGMAVGAEVFETCVWIGRFMERFGPDRCERITRGAVKTHLCHSMRAKDANVRAALIDRFGGPQSIKKGGALYGVSGDMWAALAVAVTFWDQRETEKRIA